MGLVARGRPRRRATVAALLAVSLVGFGAARRMVAAGASVSAVAAWGNNRSGELADGTTNSRTAPAVASGLAGVTSVSVGVSHVLGLRSDGAVVAWGHNRHGQLGDGTTVDRHTAVTVRGLSGASSISAGNAFSLALRGGGVFSWGNNTSGELGSGTTLDRAQPGPVVGLGSGVVAVSAGNAHALALEANGAVLAWGNNASGQLGDGKAPADRATPTQVVGLGPGSGVVAVAAGGTFSLALKGDGTVLAWGNNTSGELGDGTQPADHQTPVRVSGLGPGSGVVRLAAGATSALAVRANGAVVAWGNNQAGQLGNGRMPVDGSTPVAVGGLPQIVGIAAGRSHSLALGANGAVFAWGDNNFGQLGDGTTTRRATPVAVSGLGSGSGVTAISAGGDTSYAIAAGSSGGTTGPTFRSLTPGATSPAGSGIGTFGSNGSSGSAGSFGSLGSAGSNGSGNRGARLPSSPTAKAVHARPPLTG